MSRSVRLPRTLLAAALASAITVAPALEARAFQNPDTFSAEPTQGGGGGRFFTGSPHDAYGCEVCHRAETAPNVRVFGLPEGAYVPSAMYRVTIDWPDDRARVALMMEMTDPAGRAVGQWSEPDPTTLTGADLCVLSTDTPAGTRVIAVAPDRVVVSAIDCGQHQSTMLWTAPAYDPFTALPLPAAMLSGGLVVSNTNGKLAGDEAAPFVHTLAAPGDAPPAASILAHCSFVSAPAGSRRGGLAYALLLVASFGARLRRRRTGTLHQRPSSTPSSAKRSTSRNGLANAERKNT